MQLKQYLGEFVSEVHPHEAAYIWYMFMKSSVWVNFQAKRL